MKTTLVAGLLVAAFVHAPPATAQSPGLTKPRLVLKQVVDGMPRDERQEISVLAASFKPGDRTVFHTHRYPVTVYMLEGAFTLEMEDCPPVTIKAGEVFVEPPNVKMTGYNRSVTEPINLLIFYVSSPGGPFLDLVN